MKILILSDSLTLPRNGKGDQVLDYKDTWPQLLAQKHPDWKVAIVGIGSATSEDILYQTQYWTGFDADHILVQVGVCDALPRALHAWEVEFLKKLPGKQLWRKVMKKISVPLRKYRGITLIPEKDFRFNIARVADVMKPTSFLPILDNGNSPPHMPKAHFNICRYNQILRDAVKDCLIDIGKLPESSFMSDHYHLNATGHRHIAKAVNEHVLNKVN